MNALLVQYAWHWQLAGWTMIHFLWIGAIVALLGGVLRLACRRAAPNVRYAASLMTLAALALMPVAIAAWLAAYTPAIRAGSPPRTAAISAVAVDANTPSHVAIGDTPSQDDSATVLCSRTFSHGTK